MSAKDSMDMAEAGKFMKDMSQKKRASHREKSAEVLDSHQIVYEEKNNGAHLIVQGDKCFIDFWPGTGRWKLRTGKTGFGVFNLLKECKRDQS